MIVLDWINRRLMSQSRFLIYIATASSLMVKNTGVPAVKLPEDSTLSGEKDCDL